MSKDLDIYISHCLADNKAEKGAQGWIDSFKMFLKTFIDRHSDRKINVITSSDLYAQTKQANSKLPEALTYVVVLTNEYIKSKECNAELKNIMQNSTGNNVFKAAKENVDLSLQHEQLQQLLSYIFHNNNETPSFTFNKAKDEISERRYWIRLLDLSFDISNELMAGSADKGKNISSNKIFLAETQGNSTYYRNIIKRELIRYGYQILPDSPLSEDSSVLKGQIESYLKESLFAIHLVGDLSVDAKDISNSIDFLQNQIVADYYKNSLKDDGEGNDFSRLIWITPELRKHPERQQFTVNKFKNDIDADENVEIVQTPIEVFKSIIHENINKGNSSKVIADELTDGAASKVYMIYEKSEGEKIVAIEQLLKKEGLEVLHSTFDSDNENLMDVHRKRLVECDNVIIVYSNNNNYWIKSKLHDLIKSPGFGRRRPFISKAIITKSETKLSEGLFKHNEDVERIEYSDNPTGKAFSKFIEKIKHKDESGS